MASHHDYCDLMSLSFYCLGNYEENFEPFSDIQQDQPLPALTREIRHHYQSRDVSPLFEPRRRIYDSDSIPRGPSRSIAHPISFPNSHRKARKTKDPLSDTDSCNLAEDMARKKTTTTKKSRGESAAVARENLKLARGRTNTARAESVVGTNENARIAPDTGAIGRDHGESPGKTSDTGSDTEASPLSDRVLEKTQAVSASEIRDIFQNEVERDRNEIPLDLNLANLVPYVDELTAGDKKMKQEHRMRLIYDLRTSIYIKQQYIYGKEEEATFWESKAREFKRNKDEAESESKVLSEKLKVKSEEYAALNQKYQRKLRQLTGKRKRIVPNDQNKELMDLIENHCKGFLFSKCKFVNSDDQEENLARLVLRYGNIPKEHRKDKDQFIRAYSAHMRKCIFERRSYVQTELRKVFLNSNKKKIFHPFPTVEALKKCLTRDINTDEEYEIFVFYCEELLGKVVGASEWTSKIRCFTTISDAIRPDTDVPLISPGDEAFAVLLVDNCLDRWTEDAKREAGLSNEPKQKKKNVDGKYTTSSAGQVAFGGWNPKGLQLFNDLTDLSVKARETDQCKRVESKCLQIMRAKHKITAETWEEHQSKSRSRKKVDEKGDIECNDVKHGVVLAQVEMVELSDDEDN